MESGFENISVDFSLKAQKLFTLNYENFRVTTKNLDRQKDENVFQLQLEKFMRTLRLQLENVANDLLSKNKAIKDIDRCNQLLRDNINIYLKEFRQKARSL